MSARNRELLNLAFASIVASAAFASVSIVDTGLVTARWLGYVGVIFGLYLVAHVVARFTVPYADPTLLPLVGLLTALGLTVIYRLDPEDARRQAVWVAVGIGVLVATLIWLRYDYRDPRALQVPLRDLGGRPAAAAVRAGARAPRQRREALDQGRPDAVPAGRAREDLPDRLSRRATCATSARRSRRGASRISGPLLVIWGAAMLVLVQTSDLGSALLNFGIFLAMVYVATGRALYVGVGLALFLGGSAALYNALGRVQQRVTVWLHPWTDDRVYCSSRASSTSARTATRTSS